MGEAKRGKALRERLLATCPTCIFCGGNELATTVDHVPPRVMFNLRHRPKGMEFSACRPCNDGSRKAELVAGMLARMLPDPEPGMPQDEQRALIHSVNSNVPGLLEEMQPSKRQNVLFNSQRFLLPRGIGGALNAGGPILNQAMMLFGAKLGMALFYHDLGRVLPSEGAVFVRWYSSYDAFTDQLPNEIIGLMGAPTSIQQGKWSVGEQFLFSRAIPIERTMAAHMVSFRQSFGILTFSADDHHQMDSAPQDHVFRPGCLRLMS